MTKGTKKFSCLLAIISLGTLHVFAFPIRIFFTKKSKYVSSYVMDSTKYILCCILEAICNIFDQSTERKLVTKLFF